MNYIDKQNGIMDIKEIITQMYRALSLTDHIERTIKIKLVLRITIIACLKYVLEV